MLEHGVTEGEVSRVVTLIETELVASMQSASERADRLSMFATYFGDPALVNRQGDLYRAVTVERVNAFVRERLVPENRATLLYVPRETAAEADLAPPQNDLAMAEAP
jgi:zinc protease